MNQSKTSDFDIPTILIVDDTPSNLSVVVNLFEDRGYRVAIAQDGEEGLQRAQLVQPDLIMLDVMMPGIDGFETCRRLKEQQSTRDIPVIFMTALASSEHKVRGFGAGAVDYVTKPLQIDEVMARVGTHLKLSATQHKLAQHNEELERRVEERTAELAAREREFRTLVENAPDEIARHDRQGRFIYINPQHEQTLGVALADLIGKTHVECFPGIPDVAAYQALLMGVIETGRSLEYEATLPDVGDGPRYHSILLVAERGADGEVVGALAIGRDITELKRADAAVRERELRYRQLFENSPVSIWEEDFSAVHTYFDELRQSGVEDLDAYFNAHPEAVGHCAELARIVDVNQAAVALHRAQSKAELFAGLKQTFTPDSFRAFREELIGLWRGESEMRLDAEVQTLAGERRHVAVHFSIVPDTGTPWSKALVSLMDITERKQAEQQLAMLGAAIAKMHEAAYFIDGEARIFYVNDEASRQLGYSRDEFLGMTVMDIAPGWTKDMVVNVQQGLSENEAITFEAEHRRKDGGIVPVEINVTLLSHDGKAFALAMVRDITERKRAERELHLLNRALDNAFDATYLIDDDMHLRYVNEAAVRALGYSREELLSMTLPDIDPNLKPDMLKAVMAQTVTLGRLPGILETQHRRKDGSVFPIEVGATVFDYEGERLHLTTVRDITERKRVEEALAAREREFRTLAENIPDTIIRYDAQARKTYVNTAVARFIGVRADALIGKTPQETLPTKKANQADAYMTNLRRTLDSGEPQEIEVELHHVQQGPRVLNIRFVAERDEQGKIVGALMVGRDITERKHAESALRESEQRYREIFENVTDSLYLVEVTPEGRFRNLAFNAAFEKSTGIPREVLIGRDAGGVKEGLPEDEVVTEETARSVLAKYRHCIAVGEPIEEDSVLDLPSGVRHYHSALVPLRDESGRIYRILGVAHDVTEIKRVEHALEESRAQLRGLTARREEAREEERKYIAREVHDELGQILTGLQLNVSVLTHKFAGESPALREQLQETRMLADRALAVARNVASALRPAALDMGIVSALEWLVGRFETNTGIHCEVHAEDADIHLDESQAIALFRIVQESLTNVARHAKADRVDIDLGMMGDDYSLKVRDNGAGFDQAAAKADSFGLVGMRERALLLGGEVIINSKPGEGASVEVRIPACNVSRLS